MFFALNRLGNNKLVNLLGSATFGVYLIHESILSSYIWNGIFKVPKVQFLSPYFPILAIFDVLMLYMVCTLIDCLRIRFIEPYYLKVWNKLELLFQTHCIKKEKENV